MKFRSKNNASDAPGAYVALKGINYTPEGATEETRIEPGSPLPADFPADALADLLDLRAIAPAEGGQE